MKTETLEYSDGPTILRGFLALDGRAAGTRPGILIMPQVWGLTDHERERARRLATLGYVALAADPYGNREPITSFEEGRKLAGPLREDPSALRRRARVGLDALAAQPGVDPDRLAAIGFCVGGMFALELARSGAPVRGAVSFHGTLSTKQPAARGTVMASLLVCTGADDPLVTWDQVKGFADEMRSAGVDYEIDLYAGAKHGFTDRQADHRGVSGLAYNARADARSWTAMHGFFAEVLGR